MVGLTTMYRRKSAFTVCLLGLGAGDRRCVSIFRIMDISLIAKNSLQKITGRRFLLLWLCTFFITIQCAFAQESQPTPPPMQPGAQDKGAGQDNPPVIDTMKAHPTLQWSNRDMTYRGKNYDFLDTSYIPKFRMKQQKRYLNHQTPFPAKPRNKWEVGVGFGQYNVIGNVPTLMLWQKGGGGVNVNVRKSLGYMFSLRMQYIFGVGRNLDNQPTTSFGEPYTQFGYVPAYLATPANPATPIYRYTRTEASQLSLDLMFASHAISFNRERSTVTFFSYFGIGALAYKTRVNALNSAYSPYSFDSIVTSPSGTTSAIRKKLQSKMDNSFETPAENANTSHILDNKTLDFAPSIGVGVQYKITKEYNIQLEERYTMTSDVYIDGSRYGIPLGDVPSPGRTHDNISYFSVSVNYNLKYKKKSVEPLYWLNPLDHLFSEISYPRHMLFPNPILPDEDGDGVTDQFDKCPKTPQGIPVDVHGCPLDTDGDGVPDYKDKQLITPTECQPVDADGIGHCPCPDACADLCSPHSGKKGKCGGISDGTLYFAGNKLTELQKQQLATLASQMKAYPDCKVVVVGAGNGSKAKEELSWEHVNMIIEFMTDQNNISSERFIFQYGKEGDENIVSYRSASPDETGPSRIPPPHPELINKQ